MTVFRGTPDEGARIASLMRMLPSGTRALEIGARDGYITNFLAERVVEVVARDLERPRVAIPHVRCIAGDVRALDFPSNSVDVVLCSEVLEHIPPGDLPKACHELARVVKQHLLVGVPFEQDLRTARTLCSKCGAVNPPYGHVNRFDQARLESLFPTLRRTGVERIGTTQEGTNWLSDMLMRGAGYPWGTYHQDEPCIACGGAVGPPPERSMADKVLSSVAIRINSMQNKWRAPRAKWLHMIFAKDLPVSTT
jgi:hypothetical protein